MPERVLSPATRERRDVGFKQVAIAASLVAAALGAVLLSVLLLYPDTTTDRYLSQPVPRFAAPHLQSSPPADMAAFGALQRRQLDTAYWLDRTAGTVHLPIAAAMQKVAAEGIADWPQPGSRAP